MRVIAGKYRSRMLKTVENNRTRPTTDKNKENLFNMIGPYFDGGNCLDLFAGSGGLGIEALSRGARRATFVDNNEKAIKIIKENLEHTGLLEKANVIKSDASLSLENLSRKNEKFDIVFMDPPYDKGLYLPVLEKLSKSKLIDEFSIIILEVGLKDDAIGVEDLGYEITKVKKYKSNKHIFLRKL